MNVKSYTICQLELITLIYEHPYDIYRYPCIQPTGIFVSLKLPGNAKYWERPMAAAQKERYPWSLTTTSINIEMTAYALLVYSLRPDPVSNGLPVIRWLTSNKGPNAGFYSTQVKKYYKDYKILLSYVL